MTRIEGKSLVAYWLVTSSAVALVRLTTRGDDIIAHSAGWRAALGPLMVALLSLVAARRLQRGPRGFPLAAALLGIQVVTLSVGPLAYRLDVGPFIRLVFGGNGVTTGVGSDARLLLILGFANHVPSGVAINLLALTALVVLFAAHRSEEEPHETHLADHRR